MVCAFAVGNVPVLQKYRSLLYWSYMYMYVQPWTKLCETKILMFN